MEASLIATLLIATGVAVWRLVALLMGVNLLNRARVRRLLERPALHPYRLGARHRLGGLIIAALARLRSPRARRVSPEVVAALRTARLDDLKALREVLHEVERLPTVQRGLDALGLKPIFEGPTRGVHRIATPYTDQMQRPACYVPGVPARTFYQPRRLTRASACP